MPAYFCYLKNNGSTAENCCPAASIIIEDLNLQKKFYTVHSDMADTYRLILDILLVYLARD